MRLRHIEKWRKAEKRREEDKGKRWTEKERERELIKEFAMPIKIFRVGRFFCRTATLQQL